MTGSENKPDRAEQERRFQVLQHLSVLDDEVLKLKDRVDRVEDDVQALQTQISGSDKYAARGLRQQMADISTDIGTIKDAQKSMQQVQQEAERERQKGKDRWKWVFLGMTVASVDSIETIIGWLKSLFGVGP